MKDSETIDEIDDSYKIVLFSKLSIAFIGLIFSPLFAAILYSINLIRSDQKQKILGTFVTVYICYAFIFVGLLGFEIPGIDYFWIPGLCNILMTFFMIFPLWNKHFESVSYKTIFPVFPVALIILLILVIYGYNFIINTRFDSRNPAPWYFPNIGTTYIILLILVIPFVKLIFKIIIRLSQKLINRNN